MILIVQRILFGLLIVTSLGLFLTGCQNRPAAERWKYGSNVAKLETKKTDYIYIPEVAPDGSLSQMETDRLKRFIDKTSPKNGDRIILQYRDNHTGENAVQWVGYWIKGVYKDLPVYQSVVAGAEDQNKNDTKGSDLQVVLQKITLVLPDCETNMKSRITSVASVTKPVLGCANQANLAHMISNPSHLEEGSDMGSQNGNYAILGVQDYWRGETEPLKVDQFDALTNSSGD
ncbi:MAG: CpaD family pilus assembly lipoprotein [Alphaproteobacteria bacterium]|nr:CpaD family pilus assembly lipoprotein [Alphaproteobacteria bacterium]